ncbi:MAG: hypothetical protein P4L73_20745 [Caulobacteraceae bacterium]|nr:hypothetical protein [Caulobacteraceae bacterium]
MSRRAPVRAPAPSHPDRDDAKSVAQAINDIATELNALKDRRLDAEMFIERRDDLVRRLRRIAKRAGAPRETPLEDLTTYRPGVATGPKRIRGGARTIIVRRIG